MPMYFFDLLNGHQSRDLIGGDFPNDGAAIQEAKLRAGNVTDHQLAHYRSSNAMMVRNDEGKQIYRAEIRRR